MKPSMQRSMKPSMKPKNWLNEKYPPSASCSCDICKAYCNRPGWWTVEEAAKAIKAGYGNRMMLEVAPDYTFGVLSPAFKGCEQDFALQKYARYGCNFFLNGLCELYDTALVPLECRFCHHAREGLGQKCHDDVAKDWQTPAGQRLVAAWAEKMRIFTKYQIIHFKILQR